MRPGTISRVGLVAWLRCSRCWRNRFSADPLLPMTSRCFVITADNYEEYQDNLAPGSDRPCSNATLKPSKIAVVWKAAAAWPMPDAVLRSSKRNAAKNSSWFRGGNGVRRVYIWRLLFPDSVATAWKWSRTNITRYRWWRACSASWTQGNPNQRQLHLIAFPLCGRRMWVPQRGWRIHKPADTCGTSFTTFKQQC